MTENRHQKWQVLSSEYLSRKPWFTVRHEALELPNGNRIPDYYVLEYPDWVNVIAVAKDGRLLFVRQYRHGLGEVGVELCAGVREKSDPSPEAAARRELLEETGYGGGEWRQFMVLSPNPATHTNLTYTFLAQGVEPVAAPSPEATEDLSFELLAPGEVRELLLCDGVRQALMAAALWKYLALKPDQKS